MNEKQQDITCDVKMDTSEIVFDNLTILRELGNIANLVGDEDFLGSVPQAKMKRVQWTPMFNCLKQGILSDMVQELNSMWVCEGMPEKLAALERQKEKFSDDPERVMWRPKLGDVKSQLKAHDVANLQKEKKQLEALVKKYDANVNRLQKTLTAKRGYLKALQLDIQKYLKKSEDLQNRMSVNMERNNLEILGMSDVDFDSKFIDKHEF